VEGGATFQVTRPKILSSPHGAAFHGGVLRITQKSLYVRTTIAMTPFHHLPIDACKDENFMRLCLSLKENKFTM
jgi:hypothetical protein